METFNESSVDKAKPDTKRRRGIGRFLMNTHDWLTEDERISLIRRGAWLGGTSWHVPDTAVNPVKKIPRKLDVQSLEPAELAAAIKLGFVYRAVVPRSRWDDAQKVPERELRSAALSLLKKIRPEQAPDREHDSQ